MNVRTFDLMTQMQEDVWLFDQDVRHVAKLLIKINRFIVSRAHPDV